MWGDGLSASSGSDPQSAVCPSGWGAEDGAARELDRSRALRLMRQIGGWFSEIEAKLLWATVARALEALPGQGAVVEIGSYLGRSTVVLASAVHDLRPGGQVVAIDPHQGLVGAAGNLDQLGGPTYEQFWANMVAAGVQDVVRAVCQRSTEVSWDQPVGLLLIDGLHDYSSVCADFGHFDPWVQPGGFVAFHDYSCHWPGVVQFVDELHHSQRYVWADQAESLVVLRKQPR